MTGRLSGDQRPVIAITGHRPNKLGPDHSAVRTRIAMAMGALAARVPGTPVLLTALAAGSDTLAAEAARAAGWPVHVLLPMPIDDYERDFSGLELSTFQSWVAAADKLEELPDRRIDLSDPTPYARLGEALVDRADMLVTVWDRAPAAGAGGTAEVVGRAIDQGKVVAWVSPDEETPPGRLIEHGDPPLVRLMNTFAPARR